MTEKKNIYIYKYKYIWNIFFIYFFILYIYLLFFIIIFRYAIAYLRTGSYAPEYANSPHCSLYISSGADKGELA